MFFMMSLAIVVARFVSCAVPVRLLAPAVASLLVASLNRLFSSFDMIVSFRSALPHSCHVMQWPRYWMSSKCSTLNYIIYHFYAVVLSFGKNDAAAASNFETIQERRFSGRGAIPESRGNKVAKQRSQAEATF